MPITKPGRRHFSALWTSRVRRTFEIVDIRALGVSEKGPLREHRFAATCPLHIQSSLKIRGAKNAVPSFVKHLLGLSHKVSKPATYKLASGKHWNERVQKNMQARITLGIRCPKPSLPNPYCNRHPFLHSLLTTGEENPTICSKRHDAPTEREGILLKLLHAYRDRIEYI